MGIAFFADDEMVRFTFELFEGDRTDGSDVREFSRIDTLEHLNISRDEFLATCKDENGVEFGSLGLNFDDNIQRFGWQALGDLDPVRFEQELKIPGLQREEYYIRFDKDSVWEWDDPVAIEIVQAAREYIAKNEEQKAAQGD